MMQDYVRSDLVGAPAKENVCTVPVDIAAIPIAIVRGAAMPFCVR